MPPKRKNSKSKATASKKTKVDEDSSNSRPKTKESSTDDGESTVSVSQLYKFCVPGDPAKPPHEDQLLIWEERGALAQIVWPALVELHAKSSSSKNDSQPDQNRHQGDIQWFHACHLLALLVSLRCREGTFPATYALNFIQSNVDGGDNDSNNNLNKEVLESALQTLVQHDQRGFRFQTAVVHFALVVNTCFEETLSPNNPGLKLWRWMPARRRELEFKKHPMLQKKFASVVDPKDDQTPFLVTLMNKIIHLLEGETDGHGKRLLHLYDPAEDDENRMEEDSEQNKVMDENDGDNGDDDEDGANKRVARTASPEIWAFLHRSFELLIDLLSCHETRQYLVIYMDSIHFTVRCRLAVGNSFATYEPLRLLQQLLGRMNRFVTLLPLETSVILSGNTITSMKYLAPSPVDLVSLYHRRASILQKMCYRHYPHLKDVIYAGVGLLCNSRYNSNNNEGNAKYVRRVLGGLQEGQLTDLLHRLRLIDKAYTEFLEGKDDEFLWNVLVSYLTIPPHPLDQLQSFPLYPTETVLWDHNLIPPTHFALRRSSPVLSLPKLNKQYLSYQDYLLRNFELVRLESAYEIRSDLVDVLKRIRPLVRQSMDMEGDHEDITLKTEFSGWARMALELHTVVEVKKVEPPRLGDTLPAQVVAEFTIDLQPCGNSIRREWDELGEFDNLFLVTVDASKMTGQQAPLLKDYYSEQHEKSFSVKDGDRRVPDEEDSTFPRRYGVTAVRGCMVLQIRDENGTVLTDPAIKSPAEAATSTKRIFRVALDPAQYVSDQKSRMGVELYQVRNCRFCFRKEYISGT